MESEDPKKQHRKRAAGPKAVKKKNKKVKVDDSHLSAKQRNPKAFAVQSVNKLRKAVSRSQDKAENRLHVLDVDRSSAEPPPVLVAIVGPPKVGKTTLIKCLIRNYTKRKINNVQGPATVVTGKKQRITLVECNNDINCMLDIAKVCDLALLLIDASFGLEMEVMEFLEMCRTHGMPKVIGVLTHLDMIKNSKLQRKTKKQMKHRLWTELYQGAKLFYLSGMLNGEYQKTEVHNLARFISVQKYRPVDWRQTHPYIVADRMEDVTEPDSVRLNPKIDRNVCLYGYVRGTHFKNTSAVHIPGCGDLVIHDMSMLSDPCPLAAKVKKCSLNEKDRLIYAPWSGVGGVMWDRDAVYIDLGGSHALKPTNDNSENSKPSNELGSILFSVNEKLADSKLQLFNNTTPMSGTQIEKMNVSKIDDDDDDDGDDNSEMEEDDDDDDYDSDYDNDSAASDGDNDNDKVSDGGDDDDDESDDEDDDDNWNSESKDSKKKSLASNDSSSDDENDDDDGDDDDGHDDDDDDVDMKSDNDESGDDNNNDDDTEDVPKWKRDMSQRATKAFLERKSFNWQQIVYNQEEQKGESTTNGFGGDLFKEVSSVDAVEKTSKSIASKSLDVDFMERLSLVKDCFVTGEWNKDEDAETLIKEDDELYGDFEDLETGETHKGGDQKKKKHDDDDDESDEDDDDDGDKSDTDDDESGSDNDNETKDGAEPEVKETAQEKRARKIAEKRQRQKELAKAMFDSEYDEKGGAKTFHEQLREELTQQAQLNRAEFEGMTEEQRIEYEGFRPGLYVRVQINNVPCELVDNFDPTYPIIIGGLINGEQNIGFVHTRLKKHRWHKKILKTSDPLIVSLGWRRFQTVATYSMRDDNGRHRYIKYTPEHLHCYCTFWGPLTPLCKGMLSIRDVSRTDSGFRISSTGTVLGASKVPEVTKKMKLIGAPFKIYSKTAFIKDIFTSSLEVTKFEGGKIQTVSGIRGMIKKAIKEGPAGSFRATFEDKILLSDIVFFKTWKIVTIPQLYNLVATLLMPSADREKWKGMKTVGELKRERSIRNTVNPDHLYKPIERKQRVVKPLTIPNELQKRLPFSQKPKIMQKSKTKNNDIKTVAVVRDPSEQKVARFMKMLTTLHEDKRKGERIKMRERASQHQKHQATIDEGRAVKQKQRAKHAYYLLGQKEKQKNKD